METLVFLTGIRQGERVPLVKPVTRLGREKHNDIRVDDEGVSRSHTEIVRREGGYVIRDLGSTNGTYLNDKRIQEAVLSDGDRIALGDTILLYQIVEERRAPGRMIMFSEQAEHVSARMRLSTQEIPAPSEKRAADDFRRLSEFMWSIMPIVSLRRLCSEVLERVVAATGCSRAVVLLADEAGVLSPVALKVHDERDAPRLQVSRTITGYVLETGEALLAVDPASDPRFKDTTVIRRDTINSVIAVPLRTRERITGVLYLDTTGVAAPLKEEDLRLATAMAMPFAIAVENTRLYQQLTESVELLQGILRSLVSGILVVDQHGAIKQLNEAASEILRLRARDLISRDIREVPNLAPLAQLLTRALDEGVTVDQAEILISGGVQEIPVGVTTSLLTGVADERRGVVAAFRNLSEIKKLSERVQMSEHLAALVEMAAGIAHEVRNPLNSIRGFASLIKERVDNEKLGQFAGIIIDEVDRMNDLVQDLLDFARHRELAMGRVELGALAQEVLHEFSPQIAAAGIQQALEVPKDLAAVWGNADRLKQVIINMVRNAIEAMPTGGQLKLQAFEAQGASGREVALAISDTGEGIPPEIATKVFTPFFSRKEGGTGLGLAICQKIIKQHQGRIELDTAVGKGSTFTIFLQPHIERGQGG